VGPEELGPSVRDLEAALGSRHQPPGASKLLKIIVHFPIRQSPLASAASQTCSPHLRLIHGSPLVEDLLKARKAADSQDCVVRR
jgi:hypothetical protein